MSDTICFFAVLGGISVVTLFPTVFALVVVCLIGGVSVLCLRD